MRWLSRSAWDLAWTAWFTLRRQLRGPSCEVRTHVGPMRVDLADRGIGRSLYFYGIYEPAESRLLQALVKPGMTVVDVGANIGYHTLLAAGRAGRVVALEPEPRNLHLLRANVRLSEAASRIEVLPYALSDEAGSAFLVVHPRNAGMHHLDLHRGAPKGRSCEVATTTLDLLADALELRPDLIKIDVEGAEARVLRGAARTLQQSPEVRILMELNPRALLRLGTQPDELLDWLADLGFQPFRLTDGGWDGATAPALHPVERSWLADQVGLDAHVNLLCSRRPPFEGPPPWTLP